MTNGSAEARHWGAFRTGELPTNRVESFSDNVFGVVITLLIFNIKLPQGLRTDHELWRAVIALYPSLFAWIVSFSFVLTFWVHHHYFFASLRCCDRGLLWLNGVFLLTIALLPFPLGLMGEYSHFTAPVVLLCTTMLLASLGFSAMRFYATFLAGLLHDVISPALARRAMLANLMAPAICSISVAFAFVQPQLAMVTQGFLLVLFFFFHPSIRDVTFPDAKVSHTN